MINLPVSTTTKTISAKDIPCLLVPMADEKLLLPTVSVAEMLPFKKPHIRSAVGGLSDVPGWYLGDIIWRGVSVPMISYEAINGGDIATIKGVSQMVVLNNTGVNPKLPFLCFPTQGIPRLSRITPENIEESTSNEMKSYGQMFVQLADDVATIPDVSKLEQACIDFLAI